jgi:hypothetical protein
MLKRAVFGFALLALLFAAMPGQADAIMIRGYITNGPDPFMVDSVKMLQAAGLPDFFWTFGFGGIPDTTVSFDFRATAWPTSILLWYSKTGSGVLYDSIEGARGVSYTLYGLQPSESCVVMFDTMPAPAVEEGRGANLRSILGATPNPFGAATVIDLAPDIAGAGRIAIVDAAGRLVRTLTPVPTATGLRAVWNGTDAADRAVRNGVYFCRLAEGGSTPVHKLILNR